MSLSEFLMGLLGDYPTTSYISWQSTLDAVERRAELFEILACRIGITQEFALRAHSQERDVFRLVDALRAFLGRPKEIIDEELVSLNTDKSRGHHSSTAYAICNYQFLRKEVSFRTLSGPGLLWWIHRAILPLASINT